jgi:phosphoglycolate phosphatase-like HAD superfamily hydrolase
MVRLVLFDIDGTLIRTNGAGVEAFGQALAAEFGLERATEGVRFAGRTDVSLVREIFRRTGVESSPENFARFFACYVVLLEQLIAGRGGSVCPGVTEFIAGLRALAQPPVIGLLTGNIRQGAEIKLRHFGLWEEFAFGGFADDHEDRNQIAVAARERGRRHLGRDLAGGEIVVVGDTQHDVRCGRAIGARVVAVATGGETLEQLRPHAPDWLLGDLGEVTAETVCGAVAAPGLVR